MNHDTTNELIISAAASKSTWAGVLSMFFGWLVSSNAAIVVGMLVGVAGLLVKFYAKLQTFDTFGRGWTRRVAGNLRFAAQDN